MNKLSIKTKLFIILFELTQLVNKLSIKTKLFIILFELTQLVKFVLI